MLPRLALALLLATVLLVPQTAAHQTVTATSSTGNVDTWGITSGLPPCLQDPDVPDVPDVEIHPIHIDPSTLSVTGLVQYATEPLQDCFVQACPQDLYIFPVTLRLVNPSPIDAVAMTVVGDAPGVGPLSISGTGLPSTYPTAVATHSDPEVSVYVQLGGCNRATTVVVTGLLVDGEVTYELTY